MKLRNDIKIIALMLLVMVLLSSCTNNNSYKQTIYKGYTGLDIKFSKSTPDTLYENSTFYTRMIIENEGTHSIISNNSGVASVITDKLYLSYNEADWQEQNKSVVVEGKSIIYPEGEYIIFDLPEFYVNTIPGSIQNPKTNLHFSLCYPYSTTFTKTICVDFDPYEQDEREKICKSEEMGFTGGQGAPITVTKITPLMSTTTGNLRPQFIIDIENKGKGISIYDSENNQKVCEDNLMNSENINKIRISGTVSTYELTCAPEIIKLYDNKATTRCTISESIHGATNFQTPLNLNLEYNYIESVSKEFDIVRTKEYNSLNFITSQSCADKLVGDDCDGGMICDEHKQCVSKCDYCAKGGQTITGSVNCDGLNSDFSCACSSDECVIMGSSCKFGYCEFNECCNAGSSSRELGILYNFKDHYDEFATYLGSDQELRDNINLKALNDYRFKYLYPNSNLYCQVSLYNSGGTQLMESPISECLNNNDYIEYFFDNSKIGKAYTLAVKVYNNPEDNPVKTETFRIEIEASETGTGNCRYNGEIQSDGKSVCFYNENIDTYSVISKCEFCNKVANDETEFEDDNDDFCSLTTFQEGMGCVCDNNAINYLSIGSYVNDESFCINNNYCCIAPAQLYFNMFTSSNSLKSIIFSEGTGPNEPYDEIVLQQNQGNFKVSFFGGDLEEDEVCNFLISGFLNSNGNTEIIHDKTWDCSATDDIFEKELTPNDMIYQSYNIKICTNKKNNYNPFSFNSEGCFILDIDNIMNSCSSLGEQSCSGYLNSNACAKDDCNFGNNDIGNCVWVWEPNQEYCISCKEFCESLSSEVCEEIQQEQCGCHLDTITGECTNY